jgi:hypothetical protein
MQPALEQLAGELLLDLVIASGDDEVHGGGQLHTAGFERSAQGHPEDVGEEAPMLQGVLLGQPELLTQGPSGFPSVGCCRSSLYSTPPPNTQTELAQSAESSTS